MQQCVKAWAYGKVQGVGYRLFCKRRAKELNIEGYALNLPDGRVELVLQGEADSIEQMVESLHQGPAFANVLGVDIESCDSQPLQGFMTG